MLASLRSLPPRKCEAGSVGQGATRTKYQLTRDRVRLQSQLESLLEDCQLQIVFRRLSARLGYAKAVWAIAHRLCRLIWKVLHEGVSYVEYGAVPTQITLKRRRQRLVTQLKNLGYDAQLTPGIYNPSRA